MNVLILTPDAVGSTLLQRLLTIYMQFHQFDQPVINLHELTNGLQKFYSEEFGREIIHRRGKWGYYQSLTQVVEILQSVDHYKTARLAQYHIQARQDSLSDQLPFYQYLDENFYIIACRRQNLFEHAISQALNSVTKKLNVYSAQEKINSFYGLYRSGIEIDLNQLQAAMNRYRDYLDWADRHFTIGTYFIYEKHLKNIENFILNLPMFAAQSQRITWKQNFDIEFEHWNRCQYYSSDLGALVHTKNNIVLLGDTSDATQVDHNAVTLLQNNLPVTHQQFLKQHSKQFHDVNQSIDTMQQLGILPTKVPIKKQTLKEKLHMIRNLDQCVDVFNAWTERNPSIDKPVTVDSLRDQAQMEYSQQWDSAGLLAATSTAMLAIEQ